MSEQQAPSSPSAKDLLLEFLEKNNMVLKLTPLAQFIEGGALVIQPQQVIPEFKEPENTPIATASN